MTTAPNDLANDIAVTIVNGNRNDARHLIADHQNPAWLALAVARHLAALTGDDIIDAVVNVQSLVAFPSY